MIRKYISNITNKRNFTATICGDERKRNENKFNDNQRNDQSTKNEHQTNNGWATREG